jgi:hypothetical protein
VAIVRKKQKTNTDQAFVLFKQPLGFFCLHLCYEAENSAVEHVYADNEEAFKLTRQLTAAHLASNSSIVKRSSLLVSQRLISTSAMLTHTHTDTRGKKGVISKPNQIKTKNVDEI